ncbi:hypothetical protein KY289_008184 [Solanum tuberosum]|nr:hypothetical protein KY289_008184 [Solanum tuberosum]
MGFDDKNQALALGPEGPLMEEFWENMRRYGLYALTWTQLPGMVGGGSYRMELVKLRERQSRGIFHITASIIMLVMSIYERHDP